MSHITNPKILRIKENDDWMSRGFYGKNFPKTLEEDFKIRRFLGEKLPKGIVEALEIERSGSQTKIIIKTSRPALVIGRGGEGVEKLKKDLENNILAKNQVVEKRDLRIEVISVKDVWASASLSSQWIVGQIERRMPFRRVLKMALSKIMSIKAVRGARVEVAGRLNGIDIARTEWLKDGELPRQRIRAVMDYGFAEAHCTYGAIGVRVWIYKGDKFE